MDTKSRICISIDSDVLEIVDSISYPVARSKFLNELIKESLALLRDGKIWVNEINSPALQRILSEYRGSLLGGIAGYV